MILDGRRVPLAIGALVMLVGAATLLSAWPVGVFEDDGIYVVLAKSVATGHGYRYLNLPGEPVAAHYPPGFPLMLAALWALWPAFPENVALFKLANVILLAVAAVAGYHFASKECALPRPAAAAVAIAGALGVPALILAAMVLSETLFLALLMLSLIASERMIREPTVRRAVEVGVLCGLLALVRSLGLALLLSTLLALGVRRSWRTAAVVSGTSLALLLPWKLWVAANAGTLPAALQGKYGTYGHWFSDGVREGLGFLAAVLWRNLQELFAMVAVLFGVLPWLPMRVVAVVGVAVLLVAGTLRLLPRVPVLIGCLTLYLGVVLVWPFSPLRFIWGIWLPLAIVIAAGVLAVREWMPRSSGARAARAVALGAAGIALVGHVRYTGRGYLARWWESIPRHGATQAAPLVRWVTGMTAPGSILASDHEVLVYLYTGRQAVPTGTFTAQMHVRPSTVEEDATAMLALIRQYRADYLLVERVALTPVNGLLERRPPAITFIDTLAGGGAVFSVPR